MRVMLSSEHRYAPQLDVGAGPHPREFPSGSGHVLHDLLARGLGEAGHEVLYHLPRGADEPLPPGVRLVSEPDPSADICHGSSVLDERTAAFLASRRMPWVTTCHLDPRLREGFHERASANQIFVSKSLARSQGSERYVRNGLDPGDYHYAASKSDYLLFVSALKHAWAKGLDTAFEVARRAGVRLVVAGTASDYGLIHEIARACRENAAEYLGDVRGGEKAALFAGARALLFPTRLNEAFGLVMVEALFSGTPVICSRNGACAEVVSKEVAFLCAELDDYVAAVDRLGEIAPSACRDFAIERYHYRRMTADYLREYAIEIASHRG